MKPECEIVNETLNSLLREHADNLRVALRHKHETLTDLERFRAALESIAGWRKVNISGEYEHGLRDIIRSITDCAQAALDVQVCTLTSQDGVT